MTVICFQLASVLILIANLNYGVNSLLNPSVSRSLISRLKQNNVPNDMTSALRSATLLRNSVLKSILDDDEVYTDFETMNSDNELEKKMARELYDELRAGQLGLTIESFMKWEDIEDVLDNGIIDEETMEIIIDEVGVKNGILTFEQFYELVELVNQVSMALDGDDDLLQDENGNEILSELEREEDKGNEEAYKWLFDAVSLGQGMKKKDDREEASS